MDRHLEPEGTGTTLSLALGWSEKWPYVAAGLMDDASWDGGHDLDLTLSSITQAIDT